MQCELGLKTIVIDTCNKEAMFASLIDIFDEDDNGENGEDYLIQEAKDAGFSSNAEYWIQRYWDGDETQIETYVSNLIGEAFRSGFYTGTEC